MSENKPMSCYLLHLRDNNPYTKEMEFLSSLAKPPGRICYLSLERPYKDVVEDMKEHNIDISEFFFIDILSNAFVKHESNAMCRFIDPPVNIERVRSALKETFRKNGFSVVIIDAITSLLAYESSFQALRFVHSLRTYEEPHLRQIKTSIVMTITSELRGFDQSEELYKDLKMLADKIINLAD